MQNLNKYDYTIMIDKSGSMSVSDCPKGLNRWEQAKEWAKCIAQKCDEYDDDGIDVILFNDSFKTFKNVNASKVDELFRTNFPGGTTNTADALESIFNDYFKRKGKKSGIFGMFSKPDPMVKSTVAKPMIILCITDGEPNSQSELKQVIIDATKKLDTNDELGVTFIQVGKDSNARDFLKKLDDNLSGAKYDIVDTKDYNEMNNTSIEDVFFGALND